MDWWMIKKMNKSDQRNIKKEIVSLKSIIKRDQAYYDTLDRKDNPVGRHLFNRIECNKEKINKLSVFVNIRRISI